MALSRGGTRGRGIYQEHLTAAYGAGALWFLGARPPSGPVDPLGQRTPAVRVTDLGRLGQGRPIGSPSPPTASIQVQGAKSLGIWS